MLVKQYNDFLQVPHNLQVSLFLNAKFWNVFVLGNKQVS